MLIGLLILGAGLIVVALKNTQHELGQQLDRDLLGPQGFIAWAAAIVAIGGIGLIPGLQTPSRLLLALLATVMLLRNGGVFAQAQQALVDASAAGPAPAVPSPLITSQDSGSSSKDSGGDDGFMSALNTAVKIAAVAG